MSPNDKKRVLEIISYAAENDLDIGMVFKGYVDDLNWNHVSKMRGKNA